ncbi:MAG: AsnC family protein [Gammaproteobacteria bacterium]|nr:AsnC family protein [Gammaproteobacteria bacterium]
MLDPAVVHDAFVRALVGEIEDGLPLVARPYAAIAERLGVSESLVIHTIEALRRSGDIKRFGVVVRHHELGFCANAMVVWDVPDEEVDAVGRRFGEAPFVTLCYRRPRRGPRWPYNLFTMIHGRDREQVLGKVAELAASASAGAWRHEVLFSARRFKQRGARYRPAAEASDTTDGATL